MTWTRADVEPGQLWLRDGQIWKVVGICDEPTVLLERVDEGVVKEIVPPPHKRENHAIASLNFAKFVRLDRRWSDGSHD